jgi:hypothetical protein
MGQEQLPRQVLRRKLLETEQAYVVTLCLMHASLNFIQW